MSMTSAAAAAASATTLAIDRSQFHDTIRTIAVRTPARLCNVVLQALRSHRLLLDRPRVGVIVNDPVDAAADTKPTSKLVLLHESVTSTDAQLLPEGVRSVLAEHNLTLCTHAVELDYDYFTVEYILRRLLPAHVPAPSSFETIGTVAHLNLLDVHLPYKHAIGQAILDKNAHLRTVVNKLGKIEDEFRVFPMEVIAGEPNFNVEVREHSCLFRFDFSKVYWNSRLQSEHARLVSLFRSGQTIVDMFCGIGPFVVPAAKHLRAAPSHPPTHVLGNDKNPHSVAALRANLALNHIDTAHAFNLDARDFLPIVARMAVAQVAALEGGTIDRIDHIAMNLPALAIEFCDSLRGLFTYQADRAVPALSSSEYSYTGDDAEGDNNGGDALRAHLSPSARASLDGALPSWSERRARLESQLPWVHCYCFSSHVNPALDVVQRIERVLGVPLPSSVSSTSAAAVAAAGTPVDVANGSDAAVSDGPPLPKKKRTEVKKLVRAVNADTVSATAATAPSSSSSLAESTVHVHIVRNVAPRKEMLCVSFRLPAEAAFAEAPLGAAVGRGSGSASAEDANASESSSNVAQPIGADESGMSHARPAKRKFEE